MWFRVRGMWFRVRGLITCSPVRYCSCEYCPGHLGERILHIDTVIQASSYIEAEDLAAQAALDGVDSDEEIQSWEWNDRPYTIELPEDQFLRVLDAPSLF